VSQRGTGRSRRRSLVKRITPRHVAAVIAAAGILAGVAGAGAAAIPGHCQINGPYPDVSCTPGVPNPAVKQSNINQNICKSGWTKTVRPPVSYTNPLKLELMKSYGETGSPSDYEFDHLIALELGGSPKDPHNLWPEPHQPAPGSPEKDKVENFLKREVCAGRMTLADAQHAIVGDWIAIWKQMGSP
jgi:hypothetical protein